MAKNMILIGNFEHHGMRNWRFLLPWTQGRRESCDGFERPASTLSGQRPLHWSQHWHIVGTSTIHIAHTRVSLVDASYLWQQTDGSAGKQHSARQCLTNPLLKVQRVGLCEVLCSFLKDNMLPISKKNDSGAAPAKRASVFYVLAVTSCFCSTQSKYAKWSNHPIDWIDWINLLLPLIEMTHKHWLV